MDLLGGTPNLETQSAFMAAAAAVALATAALRLRQDLPSLLFSALTVAFGSWTLGRGADALGASWGNPLVCASLVLLGALALPTTAALAGDLERLRRNRLGLWAIPMLVCAALAFRGGHVPLLRATVTGWALLAVMSAAALMLHYASSSESRSAAEATRMRYLAMAHSVVVIGALADLALFALERPPVPGMMVALLYLYTGYLHLARVRVKDLRQLMGNAIALGFLALGLAVSFAAIRFWVGPRLDLFVFNAFVTSFVVLLFLEPTRARFQRVIDGLFVADRLELERAFLIFRSRLSQFLTLDEFLRELLDVSESIDRLRASAIYLRQGPHLGFSQVGSVGLTPQSRVNLIRHPVWVEALERGTPLVAEELETPRADRRRESERGGYELVLLTMKNLDAQLVLPLRAGSNLVGFWALSDESPEEPFSTDEIQLLHSIASEMAITIEHSKTFERVRARDRLVDLGELSGGLAHEIRNPLAAIRGAVAVLDDPQDEERAAIHRVIIDEVSRLDRVVGTFLDYANPSTQSASIPDFAAFVRGCVQAIERKYSSEDVGLSVRVDTQLPEVTANADQLECVISNVLQNAYQALDGSGEIKVRVTSAPSELCTDGAVEIAVEDDGPGMDEATLERACIPFFTQKETGLGLGLALCERLLRAQGGDLQLSSRPGEGTEVRIRVPVHPRLTGTAE